MNILLATHHLERTGGTEAFTFAMATSLRRQGYDVEYYCFKRGGVSDRIESMGIPFMSRKRYDLVLLNHKPIADNLCGKGVLLQTCHGVIPEIEQPSRYADIWVSVSEEVKAHVESLGFPTTTIWNGIDCERFKPVNALHDRLTTVLSLCQSERAHAMVKSCCERLNVEFLRADKLMDDVWEIEEMMNKADLVVGIGRSLYDAMGPYYTLLRFDRSVDVTSLVAAAAAAGVPLTVLDITTEDPSGVYRHKLVLARPDQHVAWRGDALPAEPRALIDLVRGAGTSAARAAA